MCNRVLAIFLLILFALPAFANEDPPLVKVLEGKKNQLKKDSVCQVEDVRHFDAFYDGKVTRGYKVVNKVSFRIDEGAPYFFSQAFSAQIQIRLYKTGMDTTVVDSSDHTLTLNYSDSGRYTGINSTLFFNAYRVKVKVLSDSIAVSPQLRQFLVLENELVAYPAFTFNCSDNAVKSIVHVTPTLPAPDELEVSWPNENAADEYDLEWAFVDSSALASGRYGNSNSPDHALLFESNSTRVTITANTYRIPLIYDSRGKLFFRVRAVKTGAAEQRLEANWSSGYSGGLGSYEFDGHERNLNWQATTSYAEEGKRKTVIQYYDGSLRSRQTVTRDNTSGTTVVAESFYDYQGRPIVQVLPAPTLSSVLKYSHNFNRQLNGSQYDKDNFDYLLSPSAYCNSGAAPLNDSSGTANYYSSLNPDQSDFNQYIPDAEGYPFTEVEYTQDNTGRVSRQSGVGKKYRLGSGHETRYYYGTADQGELDALFGTEVGHYSHYFKTMVRDANGQYSVSYTDMHGRTIATALAGTPDSILLDKLSSNVPDSIIERISSPEATVIRDLVMESKKSLLVPKAGEHTFTYSLDPQALQLQGCDSLQVCYSCLYDLRITITDDCNNQKLFFDTTISNFKIDSINANCASPHPGFFYQFSRFLQEGNYEITKQLSVSRNGLEYYRDSVFLPKNLCKSLEDFIADEREAIAGQADCRPTCQSCTDSLGTWDSFRIRFMDRGGVSVVDTASHRGLAWSAYVQAKEACDQLCSGGVSELKATRDAMLLDLTPPSGQYANLDSFATGTAFNIFRTPGSDSATYKKVYNYLDEEGRPDIVYSESAGAFLPPRQLDAEAFSSKFKRSWAESLLPYHPEYCKLTYQEQFAASFEWDIAFEATNTYAEALQKGYLNPTGGTGAPFAAFQPVGVTTVPDPITLFSSYPYKTNIENKIKQYFSNSGQYITLWAFSTALTACADRSSSCFLNYLTDDSAFHAGLCVGDRDIAWRNFRTLYLKIKRDMVYAQTTAACPNSPTAEQIVQVHRTPHFGDASSLLAAYGMTMSTTASGATAQVSGQMTNSFADNCKAYAVQWWEQLRPCNYNSADSAVIIPRLIQVCTEGSDISHPFGSSTVSPASRFRFRTFEDVIRHFADSSGRAYNATCNSYLITAPLPYDNAPALSNLALYSKPDSCLCEKVTKYYVEYQASSDASFSAYMLRKTGTNISSGVLDSLRNLCSGAINCTYLANPLNLPPALQCNVKNVCIDCIQLKEGIARYRRDFPSNEPAAPSSTTDSVQIRRNQLFASYLNQSFGYNKSWDEYLGFMDSCRLNTAAGDTLWTRIMDFKDYYVNRRPSIYRNYAISPLTYEFVDMANALLADSRGDRLPSGFSYGPWDSTWTAKLRSISWNEYNTKHQLIAPYSLKYAMEYGRPDTSGIKFQVPIPGDFAQPPSHRDLNNKFVAISVSQWDKYFSNYIDWKYWSGFKSITKISTPPAKFLFYQGEPDPIHGQTFLFYWIPPWVNDSATFAKFYDDSAYVRSNFTYSNYCIRPDSIKKIVGISLDTQWIHPNEVTINAQITRFRYSTKGIKAELLMRNGTTQYAYMYASYSYTPHWVYREGIDTSLYSLDCKKAFTYFFNKRGNTTYTQAQVDSIYNAAGVPKAYCYNDPIPQLCGKNEPLFPEVNVDEVDNCSDSSFFAISGGTEKFNAYADSVRNYFDSAYRTRCLKALQFETFTVKHAFNEYHYTLYYYDQAGNLVKTLPPAGVTPIHRQSFLDSVQAARNAGISLLPPHTLATQYRYNTLNQVVAQQSPDGGRSEFWYDRLGRLAVSQNSKQRLDSNYSYTLYDALGRITEVGQLRQSEVMEDGTSRHPGSLFEWLDDAEASREQITRTVYDIAYPGWTGVSQPPLVQRHLRNRVAYTTYSEGNNPDQYNSGTFYTYDVHGNVDTLLQDFGSSSVTATQNAMNGTANRFKKVSYRFDLISGKVNSVAYQEGHADQIFHRYHYDAENRLIDVETSIDNFHWDKDARYSYYKHGPLARSVLGGQSVQGIDYAYTLQGWLKGVNGTSLKPGYDMGGDGLSAGANQYTAKDAYSFSLNYHAGDYKAVGGTTLFPGSSAYLGGGYKPLYNGNISSMAVNIGVFNAPMLYGYTYDQLNRITGMDAYTGLNEGANSWSPLALSTNYTERVRYDANGNILGYLRNGTTANGQPLAMDSLNYEYLTGTNQLGRVRDNVAASNYAADIDDQPIYNYAYDPIGNLVKDSLEGIFRIDWTVYGKIKTVYKRNDTTISYRYDASGNRIAKTVIPGAGTPKTTWYVRDASGNVMAIYNDSANRMLLKEQHLYGSSRLGIRERLGVVTGTGEQAFDYSNVSVVRGEKRYELSNHLGNVLVTISDRKYGVDTSGDGEADRYVADVMSAQDYYPFGMQMPGRFISSQSEYRYGFNAKEYDPETGSQDYGERIFNPQLARFFSVDPVCAEYPMLTPYQFASNRPMDGIDLDGLEWKPVFGTQGNVTDYSWSGFNADGSAPRGTVGSATLLRGNEIFRYGSSSQFGKMGSLAVDDGSDITKVAVLNSDGSAVYNFQTIGDDGQLLTISNSQELGGNYKGVSGAQLGITLNQKLADLSKPDDAPVEGDNLGLFDWVGPAELKMLGAGLTGTLIRKEVASTLLRNIATKREISVARRAGVRQAWKEERELLIQTGGGTRRWSLAEKAELIKKGKVKGYVGHHINSVHNNSLAMARNPDNVEFVKKGAKHLQKHKGNYSNPTSGALKSRKKKSGGNGG